MDALERSYTYGRSPLPQNAPSIPLKTYLFGTPISHSLSPLLQNTMFQYPPSKWTFHLCETTDPTLFRRTLQDNSCIGTSITMPNKLSFQPVLDALTDEARVMGSVNTTFVRLSPSGQRLYIGTNTDCIGTRDAILAKAPDAAVKAKGKPAMVIGAGGAARSSIYALWKWFGVSEVYIVNRVKGEVDILIQDLKDSMPGLSIRHLGSVKEAGVWPVPFLVIGTVPDFEPKEPGEVLARDIVQRVLRRGMGDGVVADMCYSPSVWTFVYSAGARNGWRVVSGVEVVVRVCIAQQVLWLERAPDERGVQEALDAVSKISAADAKL